MRVGVDLKDGRSYDIHIGSMGGVEFAGRKVLVVTNPLVAGMHIGYLLKRIKAKELYVVTLPDGEEYKSFESLERILNAAFAHRLDRKSLFVAFGGGVIGDMTGFAAGIFQRGIDFIQIPTTLLSMVDASVGGKTGINNRYGKNLVGLFHQPKAVYADPHFLNTLPKREFGAGVAEIVKMAVTFDAEFFWWLSNNRLEDEDNLKRAIKKSIEIKAQVVGEDEKESGIRAALNYGHTFAHVIENITNYKTYLHGEAVSIGIIMANRLALKLHNITKSEADEIERLLSGYGLPTHFKIDDESGFYEHFFLDKKSANDKITFILPKGIGGVELRDDIPKELLLETLREFK